MEIATYQTTPEENGNGTYFFTDCGHWMFSIRNHIEYHGHLYNEKQTTLYILGSKEENEHLKKTRNVKHTRSFK